MADFLTPIVVAALIPSLFAATFLALYIGTRCNLSVLRDRNAILTEANRHLRDALEGADEELGYHQDVEVRLRAVIGRLFGDNAVVEIDQALWAADVAVGLDQDTRDWLEGQR